MTASAADYFRAVYQCDGLEEVRVFPSSDQVCRAYGARALTIGNRIHFRSGEFAPHTRRGFWLLAHEVAHVVQQRRGPVTSGPVMAVGPADAPEETEATAAADAALAGRPFTFARPAPAGLASAPGRPVVQRYMAWEHLLLGHAGPQEARNLVREARDASGDGGFADYCSLLTALGRDPENVIAGDVTAVHGTPAVRLPGSGVVVTLGELSILPDYLSRPDDIERAPREFILPLVQSTRAWNIRELRGAAGHPLMSKPGRRRQRLRPAMVYPSLGGIAELAEGVQVTRLGRRCGFPPWECYQSVVARNACHFAPFSWYRWQEYHLKARRLAQQAHHAKEPAERDLLTTKAWISAGYADHFLQDSFAAGHLINKTLVMQWYAELLAGSRLPVPERRHLAAVTTAAQPCLHGPGYYRPVADDHDPDRLVPSPTPGAPGVADPQAAAEAATLEGRVAASGVIGNDLTERMTAYSSYLILLRSSVVQSATGTIHDYLNERSLVVAAGQDGERFRMYGDWSMLQGEDSAARAAEAGHLSRQAIADLLEVGETVIASRKIFETFPDHIEHDGTMMPLERWHATHLRDRCFADFFRTRSTRLLRAGTTIAFRHLGNPSADVKPVVRPRRR
ncbi:MAG: DUF4157 domain-containing protein [Nocardiopsaceae bacterium]|nr:DUF4157 domain-containing protein [Nocardiopsaceae bacterium]